MHLHLTHRHLAPQAYSNITVNSETVIFPLYNLSGQMIGYQQYRPSGSKQERRNPKLGKYFTYVSKHTGNAVWGLDVLNPSDKRIFLVEGIFKACRFHNNNCNSIATLSNNPKPIMSWLHSLGYSVHTVCDGDQAGRKLAKFGNSHTYLPDGVYVDEMSDEAIKELIKSITEK
jgi:hypothetical protein